MKYLLDTSALLAHFRNEVGALEVQELFEKPEIDIYLSTISIVEFARSAQRLGLSPDESIAIALEYSALATKTIPVDKEVSIRAFDIIRNSSVRVPLIDALIAATASLTQATLLHRDSHYDTIPPDIVRMKKIS